MNNLEVIVGSKSKAEIFRLLFEKPGVELYLRELHRQTNLSIRPIQEEINKLLAAELILSRKDGNRVYYRANADHPLFPEIRSLVEKTSGAFNFLRDALSVPEIHIAFIFGSVAAGTAKPESDLDLFVIGTIGLRQLSKLISGLSDRIGRIINPHVMSQEEFLNKVKDKNHFISNILKTPTKFVIGDEDDLKRLGKK